MKPPSPSPSPTLPRPPKRIRLESSSPSPSPTPKATTDNDKIELVEGDHCSVCLQQLVDRTVIPTCAHEFCFECILVWTEQSRRCPLCSQRINEYLIHHIRSKFDYQKHYLAPLRTSPPPLQSLSIRRRGGGRREGQRRERPWGRRGRRNAEDIDEADELERAIARRKWVYDHGLYAKHVASNSFTRYRPYPSPAQFSSSPDLITRMTIFLRRELRVWMSLDVEFLTTFTLSLMKSIDIRSEAAVNLLAEFLDMDTGQNSQVGGSRKNAEHFAHEVYCYLRSPYRDLSVYDSVVQYDTPTDLPPPVELEQSRRWRIVPSRSRSRSRSRSGSQPLRSHSRSRHYLRHQSRSRSRSSSRPNSRERHRHVSPPLARRRRRVDDNERRSSSSRPHPPASRRRTGRSRSRSRSRAHEERDDGLASSRQRDERASRRRKHSGKVHRRVDTSTPIPPHSHSPSPISVNVVSPEQTGSYDRPSNVPAMESRKDKHQAADGDEDVVMEAERHSHLRSRSPSGVQTQAEPTTDAGDQVRGKRSSEMNEDAVLETETTTKIRPVTNVKRLRPNRNVGILQAVQAHLGSSSSAKPNGPGRQKQVDVGPSNQATVDEFGDKTDVAVGNYPARMLEPSSSAEAKPLLLARLSEQRPKSTLSEIGTADTPSRRPTEDVDAQGPKSTLSAPEIMARTRARLAKLKNEPVAGVLPAVSAGLKSDDADGGGTQASADDDIRARLLNRLEEEKRQITSPELDSPYPTLPAANTSRTLKAALDPQTAEAKLRKQAQVRVRLAAAKRAAGDRPPSGSVDDAYSNADEMRESGREASLKAKLRERRT